MKKVKNSILFLLIGIAIVAFSSTGQAQKKKGNSLLWKIEGNGIKTSYLMGTFHIIPQKDFEVKEKVKSAFKDSEQIVLELDMDDPGMQAEMMKHIMIKSDKTLKDYMTEDEYALLDKKLLETLGQGLTTLGKMKPIALTSVITMSLMGQQPASYEMTFVNMAKEQQKEVYGLETIEEQMQVFEDISYESQLDEIIEMIQDQEITNTYFSKLITAYKAEDLDKIMDQMEEYTDDAEQQAILLDNRNKNWIPKIGEFAADKSTFFGVGAGHLPGKNGVINLLKKAGYRVTPIHD
ncbi:MAG: TraB/GumN family protein [Cyclobacteriaceae bacterium]